MDFFKGEEVSYFSIALKNERWDLAAHIIVLAAARAVSRGEQPNGKEGKSKKRRAAGQ
jgi:hypothetical protein